MGCDRALQRDSGIHLQSGTRKRVHARAHAAPDVGTTLGGSRQTRSKMLTQLSASAALRFCLSSTDAVMLTVWPSGTGHLEDVEHWLSAAQAKVLYSAPIDLTSEAAELLTVLALYDGEEWLESNCWYSEQPLPTGPPSGPFAGAKWKRACAAHACLNQTITGFDSHSDLLLLPDDDSCALPRLCYRNPTDRRPHAFVCDVSACGGGLWSRKYTIRCTLASNSGNPGNSCIHLTDEQDEAVLTQFLSGQGGGLASGMACDSSYAYACGRALLHPASIKWLNSNAADLGEPTTLGSEPFRAAWARYTRWLHSPPRAPPIGSCQGRASDEFEEAPSFLP